MKLNLLPYGTLKQKLEAWYKLKTEKCEHCGLRLRKDYDSCYGGIDVEAGGSKETFYVCNLCYHFSKKCGQR